MTEHEIQCAVIRWFRLNYPTFAKHLFAIPNGGARHVATAGKLKAEGVLPGVYDLFLIKRNKDYPGLWLELKAAKGKLSEAQKEFGDRAREEGYCVKEAWSFEEAIAIIKEYLDAA